MGPHLHVEGVFVPLIGTESDAGSKLLEHFSRKEPREFQVCDQPPNEV